MKEILTGIIDHLISKQTLAFEKNNDNEKIANEQILLIRKGLKSEKDYSYPMVELMRLCKLKNELV